MANFPQSLDTGSTLPTNYVTGNVLPAVTINNINAVLLSVEAKLGIGNSTPGTVGQVLTVVAPGQTSYTTPASGGSSSTATSINSVAVSTTAPSANQVLLATGNANAAWTTLTPAMVAPRTVTGTYSTSMTPTGGTAEVWRVILTASTGTINAPSGTPYDNQPLEIHLVQDGTGSRTVTWAAAYNFGSAGAPTLTTTANKTDVLGFRWSAAQSCWRYYGVAPGF